MHQVSGHLDYQMAKDLALSSKVYFNGIIDDRMVTYTANAASTAPRQQRYWNENHYGWLNTLTWNANDWLVLDGGFNLERQDNKYIRYRYAYTVPTNFTTPATTSNNDNYTVDNLGAYVQAIIKPSEHWKIIPAFRADKFSGNTLLSTGVAGPMQDYGWINQPKLSLVYSPTQKSSIYANWGKTFQIATGSRDPAYLTPGALTKKPSINTGIELGVKFQPIDQTDVRLAVWQQDATDEIANLPSAGATQNLGQTRRKGVDFQLTSNVTDNTKLWFSHSIQEAKIVGGYLSGGVSLTGKEVFATPRYITNVGGEYRATEVLRFSLQGRAQGSYYIDDLNIQGKFGGMVLFDGSVNYAISKTVDLDFQVKNLLSRNYEYVWYDNFYWPAGQFQPMFSPGPGRAVYLSVNFKM
jgi:iron complex outermembrane receptor protein